MVPRSKSGRIWIVPISKRVGSTKQSIQFPHCHHIVQFRFCQIVLVRHGLRNKWSIQIWNLPPLQRSGTKIGHAPVPAYIWELNFKVYKEIHIVNQLLINWEFRAKSFRQNSSHRLDEVLIGFRTVIGICRVYWQFWLVQLIPRKFKLTVHH